MKLKEKLANEFCEQADLREGKGAYLVGFEKCRSLLADMFPYPIPSNSKYNGMTYEQIFNDVIKNLGEEEVE